MNKQKLLKRRKVRKSAKVARRRSKGWGTALRRQRLYNTAINAMQPLIAFLRDRRKILKYLSENKEIVQKQFPREGLQATPQIPKKVDGGEYVIGKHKDVFQKLNVNQHE